MFMDQMGIRREELAADSQVGGRASYREASEKTDNNLFIQQAFGSVIGTERDEMD